MMDVEGRNYKKSLLIRLSVGLAVAGSLFGVIICILAYTSGNLNFHRELNWQQFYNIAGVIGGIVGPVWTLVGSLIIYKTFNLQDTQNQIQSEGINASISIAGVQQFESSLFNMMEMQLRIKDNISFDLKNSFSKNKRGQQKEGIITGEEFFDYLNGVFELWYEQDASFDKELEFVNVDNKHLADTPPTSEPLARLKDKYPEFYGHYHIYLEQYFYHLQMLLSFIKNHVQSHSSQTSKTDFYVRIFLSQLTGAELVQIFYYSIISEEFKMLLGEFKILVRLSIGNFNSLPEPEKIMQIINELNERE